VGVQTAEVTGSVVLGLTAALTVGIDG